METLSDNLKKKTMISNISMAANGLFATLALVYFFKKQQKSNINDEQSNPPKDNSQ